MNYMDEVAEMLGVEPYDEFKVKGFEDDKFMLTPNGMFYYDVEDGKWQESLLIYDILKGTREIAKPILDEREKECLSDMIKPFRNRVKSIQKRSDTGTLEWIWVKTEEDSAFRLYFEKGAMYKGMKLREEYTLEDLGL